MEEEQAVSAEAAEEVQAETPAEEAAPAAEEQAAEAPETGEPPEPKKKSAQERINEVVRKQREAEREREYWKQVALAKEQAIRQQTEPAQPPVNPMFPPRPTLDQYETTAAYEDALLSWHETRKEISARAARQQEEQQRALRTFNDRANALRTEHEDFDEVVESPVFSPIMRATLLNSENGPDVAYHLGLPQNRADADRIRALPPELQPYELGRLETKLMLAKQTKKVPSAPAPIKPVGMSGTGAEKDPGKMSIDEWMAWDRKRTMEKLKAKYGGT